MDVVRVICMSLRSWLLLQCNHQCWNAWGPYGMPGGHMECLGTIWNAWGPYGMPGDHMECLGAIWNAWGPYGIMPGGHISSFLGLVAGCQLSCEYLQWWHEEKAQCCSQFPWRPQGHVFR